MSLRRRRRSVDRSKLPGELLLDWGLPALAAATALLAPIFWDLTPETDRLKSFFFYAFALTGLTAVLLVVAQGSRAVRKASAVRRNLTEFNHNLSDTIRSLGRLIQSPNAADDRSAFFNAVVSEAKSLIPLESARICVYDLEAVDPDVEQAAGPAAEEAVDADLDEGQGKVEYYLKLAAYGGRGDHPRLEFTSKTSHGAAAIEVARGTTIRCVDDPAEHGEKVQRDDEALWRSYLAVPLKLNSQPVGVVTIDTTRATRFTDDHKAVAATIARFLELGMSNVVEAAHDTRPEVAQLFSQLRALRAARPVSAGAGRVSVREEGEGDGNDQ